MSTYMERIESKRKEVFANKGKEKKESKKRSFNLSRDQYEFAKKTIRLIQDDAYLEFLNFLALKRANLLTHPYEKRPECKRDEFEYVIGFNDGFYKGLLSATSEIEWIWKAYLQIEEEEKERKHENEKS